MSMQQKETCINNLTLNVEHKNGTKKIAYMLTDIEALKQKIEKSFNLPS